MPRLLTEYNNYLASQNEPLIDHINNQIEWLWWSFSVDTCGSGSADYSISVNGASCFEYGAFTNIAPGDHDPLVEFNCGSYGIYTFFLRVTASGGCSKLASICYDVSNCSVCDSSATIQLENGCDLLVADTNCPNPTYEWRDPDNIFVGSTQSITATKTGIYTVKVYNCPNCSLPVTDTIYVDCGSQVICNCSTSISINNCVLSASSCTGWLITWERSLSQFSGYVSTGDTGTTHTPQLNNYYYRARYTKSGCTNKYTSPIFVDCIVQPCGITIDSMLIDGNCEIQVSWSGANQAIVPQWYKYNEISGSCNVSDTSKFPVNLGTSSSSSSTSGTATIDPQNGEGCYEIELDDGTCVVTGKIYWQNCCSLPCDGNYRVRAWFYDHSDQISQATVEDMYIESFRINSGSGFVEEVPSPVQLTWSTDILIGSDNYNPSLVNSINGLGILHVTAELPTSNDLLPYGVDIDRFFRLRVPDCWTYDLRLRWYPAFNNADSWFSGGNSQNVQSWSGNWDLKYGGITIDGTRYDPTSEIVLWNEVSEQQNADDVANHIKSVIDSLGANYESIEIFVWRDTSVADFRGIGIQIKNYSNESVTHFVHLYRYLPDTGSAFDFGNNMGSFNYDYYGTNYGTPDHTITNGSYSPDLKYHEYKFLNNGTGTYKYVDESDAGNNIAETNFVIWDVTGASYVGYNVTPSNVQSDNNNFIENDC